MTACIHAARALSTLVSFFALAFVASSQVSTLRDSGAAEELLLQVRQESMDDGLTRAWALYWTSAALQQSLELGLRATLKESQLFRIRVLMGHGFAKNSRHSLSTTRLGAAASLRSTPLVHVRQAAVGWVSGVFEVPHAVTKAQAVLFKLLRHRTLS